MKLLIGLILIFQIVQPLTLKAYSKKSIDSTYSITINQMRAIIQDRANLDSLKARFLLLKANNDSLIIAKNTVQKAFEICSQQSQANKQVSKLQKNINSNQKAQIKGWKRRLIWQKIKLPMVAAVSILIGLKL